MTCDVSVRNKGKSENTGTITWGIRCIMETIFRKLSFNIGGFIWNRHRQKSSKLEGPFKCCKKAAGTQGYRANKH